MTTETPEPISVDERLQDALIAFTGCIGESLDGICTYGLTVGDSYVPFRPDEDDDCDYGEESCTQAWVRVAGVVPKYQNDSFDTDDCGALLSLTLEVGVLRCFGIPEGGEAPTASEVLLAATQSMADMRAMYCAAMGCEVWDSIASGTWVPVGPEGGQYGGIWTFDVEF